ncbi:MAG: hypothetical protein ACK56I_19070, partial [bacterium]
MLGCPRMGSIPPLVAMRGWPTNCCRCCNVCSRVSRRGGAGDEREGRRRRFAAGRERPWETPGEVHAQDGGGAWPSRNVADVEDN